MKPDETIVAAQRLHSVESFLDAESRTCRRLVILDVLQSDVLRQALVASLFLLIRGVSALIEHSAALMSSLDGVSLLWERIVAEEDENIVFCRFV